MALLLAGHSAKAANDAYSTTATSGNFSTSFTLGTTTPAANGTSSPASGDALFFGTETTGTTTVNNDLTGYSFAGFTFNTGASAFTIGGNTFTLTGGITNNSTSLETFTTSSGALTQSNSQTYTLGGGLTITNGLAITGANNTTLTANGVGSTLTLGALNVNTSGSRLGTIINGTGNVNVTGNITAGDIVDNLTYSGTGTLTIGGGFALNGNGSSLNVSSGTIKLTSAQQGAPVNVTGTGAFVETGAGSILNNGSPAPTFIQNSTGTSILSGTNTYGGTTTVNAGTLLLDFSGATTPAAATNIINNAANSSGLSLGGGTLGINGGGTGDTNSQRFNGVTLTGATASKLSFTQNGDTSLSAALGTITRNTGSVVDVTLPTAGAVTTSANNNNGVLASAATNGNAFRHGQRRDGVCLQHHRHHRGDLTPVAGTYGATANVSVSTGGRAGERRWVRTL